MGSGLGSPTRAVDGSGWHDRWIDSWQTLAALNNAEWCDAVCRSHGLRTVIDDAAWTCTTRAPPCYPDAVTLVRHPSVPDLLARIDTSAGCSIKDSFATLDLGAYGFSVLFDAQWIVRPATEVAPTSTGLTWEVIREPEDLTRWERVWRGDDGPEGLFRPELLTNDAVVFLAARRHDQVAAGAVLNRASNAVVGISNMFSDALDVAACWSDCIATASSMFSGATLVGYESDEMLESARAHGFEATGALRVWVSDG